MFEKPEKARGCIISSSHPHGENDERLEELSPSQQQSLRFLSGQQFLFLPHVPVPHPFPQKRYSKINRQQ